MGDGSSDGEGGESSESERPSLEGQMIMNSENPEENRELGEKETGEE